MPLLNIPVHKATQSPMLRVALNLQLWCLRVYPSTGPREKRWKGTLWETPLYLCGWQFPPCAYSGRGGDVHWQLTCLTMVWGLLLLSDWQDPCRGLGCSLLGFCSRNYISLSFFSWLLLEAMKNKLGES